MNRKPLFLIPVKNKTTECIIERTSILTNKSLHTWDFNMLVE